MLFAFLALAWIALLATGPEEVTLIWPPSGVLFAALLYFGPRWWWLPALGIPLIHLLMAPVPLSFVPWSTLSNVAGGLAGMYLVRRIAPNVLQRFDVPAGAALLAGGIVMAAISALIGSLGMYFSGQSSLAQLPLNALRWGMGDLFGIVVISPVTLALLERTVKRNPPPPELSGYARPLERWIWLAILVAILGFSAWLAHVGQGHSLAVIGLPLAALVWAAVRLPPTLIMTANAAVTLLVATAVGAGLTGPAPDSPASAATLSAFLAVIAAIPITLSMGLHQSRVASARLLRRANTDALTGTLSRSAFEYRTRRALVAEPPCSLALAYIDLDRFRLINDAFNHAIGDDLICAVAGVLRANLTPGDELARIGGDEFAVLMHGIEADAASQRAQRLCEAVADFRFQVGDHVAAPTISIGLVQAGTGQADFGNLLALADTACFTAKELGGNRIQRVEPGQQDIVRESSDTMRWALRLGHAIELDHFELHCQSIAPLQPVDDALRHFEVLIRLREPGQTLILPGQFIAAAERYGLAGRLDRHVLDKTLRWFNRNPDRARNVRLCAVNLSASSLQDDLFLDHLASRLASSTLRPEQLCFELTETCALIDLGRAQAFIASVRSLGCRFALDDFGTGFCSFGYLQSLDVDYFKIDGSFVRELDSSPLAHAIVRSITDIGRVMRKQTIAECTETDAIRQRLFDLGVNFAQGYAIDHPTPIERYFDSTTQAQATA